MRSVFRFLLIFSLICFSTYASAESSPDISPDPLASSSGLNEGVYIDLGVGYGYSNWRSFNAGAFNGYSTTLLGIVNSGSSGGFSAGFDVGYQVNRFIGVEGGWYFLPSASGNSNIATSLPTLRVTSWLVYLALKVIAPVSNHFQFTFKVGPSYRRLNYTRNATGIAGFGSNQTNYVSAVVGGGIQYWFTDNWSMSLQDLYMIGNTSGTVISEHAPGANLALVSVGYRFGVVSS